MGAWRGLIPILLVAAALAPACASAPLAGRPQPFPSAPEPAWAGRAAAMPEAVGIVEDALALRGVPYRFGGTVPETGLDCSGLVHYVFGRHGIALPRTVIGQHTVGRSVAAGDVAPGDLLFFSTTAPGPSHVGIALGSSSHAFVHAPGTGSVVRVERFDTPYWQRRLVMIRRVR